MPCSRTSTRGRTQEVLAALRGPGADPIWIWGSAGCGKSHLLQAVCAATEGPRRLHSLVPIGAALPPEALRGFADCRVVCVDDVDAAAGDLGWEQALFRLFNEASGIARAARFRGARGTSPDRVAAR
jgi:DnaA family protein